MSIEFDHMIADMESNKKLHPIVTELFLRCRKYLLDKAYFYTIILFKSV